MVGLDNTNIYFFGILNLLIIVLLSCIIYGEKIRIILKTGSDKTMFISAPVKEWHAGKTKIFMKETLENILEQQRVKILGTAAVFIQKYWRGAIARLVLCNEMKFSTKYNLQ